MKFLVTMCVIGILALAGIILADRNISGQPVLDRLKNFNHWTVRYHWTDPENRLIKVILDESVDATDASCASVLHMLDALSQLAPTWEILLISGNPKSAWVPLRDNPIDRAGVLKMLYDEMDYARNALETLRRLEREDPDDRFMNYKMFWNHRYASSHR